jgi:hypothetical protein
MRDRDCYLQSLYFRNASKFYNTWYSMGMACLLNHTEQERYFMAPENKNNERTVYHVSPDESAKRWVVSQANGDFRREFDTREDALDLAKLKAKVDQFSQIRVYRTDGSMDYERTYGEDPRDISG